MDRQLLITWAVNFAFAILVAISYVMYGIAFNKVGSFPQGREAAEFIKYAFTVMLNPYFIAGLGLALTGSLVRMALFSLIGISRSALAAELSLVLMLLLSAIVFHESPRFPRDYIGGFLILVGSYVVAG